VKKKAARTMPSTISASFAPVVAAFAGDQQVGCGRMFSSNTVLNVNGKIFAMQVKGKLVVKLPKQRVEELVTNGRGHYFDPGHGRLMKNGLRWTCQKPNGSNWPKRLIALLRQASPETHSDCERFQRDASRFEW
jgi:hypothetical protein